MANPSVLIACHTVVRREKRAVRSDELPSKVRSRTEQSVIGRAFVRTKSGWRGRGLLPLLRVQMPPLSRIVCVPDGGNLVGADADVGATGG